MTPSPFCVNCRRVISAAGSLAVLLLVSCTDSLEPPRPNVVLVIVDTLRADRLPFYGCPQNTAPFLNDLAQRSLVFENAWSTSSWTLPATVSLLTSVHPFQHGVTNLVGLELEPGQEPVPVNCIPDELETLAESMRMAGYRTYAVVSNLLVGQQVGFDRGFDRFVQLQDEDADAVNAQVENWQSEMLGNEPFFLYLHYIDPHDPYHAREPWFDRERSMTEAGWPEEYSIEGADAKADLDWIATRLDPIPEEFQGKRAEDLSPPELHRLLAWIKAAYDSEIGFVDSRIRAVFEMLGLENAVVVFASDHGEEFYEHGDLTHGQNLYGESVRVPLLVHLPDARSGRVKAPCSTLDIVPTLRQLLHLPSSRQDEGQDLLGEATRHPIVSILEGKSGQHALEGDLRSVVLDDRRLIATEDGPAELYDLASDPWERTNLAEELPEVVAQLLRELANVEQSAVRWPRTLRLPAPPSEAMLEHLKGIGYLGDK